MGKDKSVRTKVQGETSSSEGGAAAGNPLFIWGAAVPIGGIAVWDNYTRALGVAAVLCFLAVIALAVPTIFDHWRRWRQAREMDATLRSKKPKDGPTVLRQIEPLNKTKNVPQHVLGWLSEDEDTVPASASNRKKSILIADDDPVVVLSLSRRLQQLGYTVLRSPDAVHALMGAMKVRPDLIILDVNMPSGNGLAVCEMMASDPQYADIPIIIHSIIADEATKERCRQLGAHHVEKSAKSWTQIRALVEDLLDDAKTVEKPRVEAPWETQKPATAAIVEKNIVAKDIVAKDDVKKDAAKDAMEETVKEAKQRAVEPPTVAAIAPSAPQRGRPRVLCIESPKDQLKFVDHQLSGLGMEVSRTSDLEEGFWTCFTENPQVIIIQAEATKEKLSKLLDDLAAHPVTRSFPVLWIDEGHLAAEGRISVASNVKVLRHPMDWEEFLMDLEEIIPKFGRRWSDPLAKAASPEADDECQVVAFEHRPLRILCIDDDSVVTRSVALRLKPYGIQVEAVDNGTEGYLHAESKLPDLILLDLMMPQGDGNYVLGKLKDNPRTRQIPVIMLTIEDAAATKRRMFSLGVDAFVGKPVDWRNLFAEMGRCVPLPKQLLVDYKLPEQLTIQQL